MNAQERIIRYWHAVELLQPSQLKKPEDSAGRSPKDEFVHDIQSSNEPFPWEPGSEASRQPLPLDEIDKRTGKPKVYTWFHTLYVQIFPTKTITDALDRAFGADQGYRDPAEREYSALSAAEFTRDGQLVPGSFTLSSEAWFLGRLTSGSDWSKDFNQDQTSIRQQAEARLTGSVNRQALDELTTFVIQQCGLQTVLSNPEKAVLRSCSRPVEVKGQQHDTISDTAVGVIPAKAAPTSRPSAHVVADTSKGGGTATGESITRPQPRQSDLPLNSFLLDDLIQVAEAVATGNTSKALSQYLDPNASITRHTIGSAELESAIVDHLLPHKHPTGCWPAEEHRGLVHAQQLAINFILEQLGEGAGILGINGPPGTGKTTLLRDLVAAIVTQRADALAQLPRASDAFQKNAKETGNASGKKQNAHPLQPDLFGYEIIVASSNNGAVENITRELPQRNKIDGSWLPEADYFGELGTLTSGAPSWALISAALGSKSRRSKFIDHYFFGNRTREELVAITGKLQYPHGLQGWLSGHANQYKSMSMSNASANRQQRWQQAVESYNEAKAAESSIRHSVDAFLTKIQHIQSQRNRLPALLSTLQTLENSLPDPIAVLERDADSGLLAAQSRQKACAAEVLQHQTRKPGLWQNLATLWSASRAWQANQASLQATQLRAEQAVAQWQLLQHHQNQTATDVQNAIQDATRLQAQHIVSWLQTGHTTGDRQNELHEPWPLPHWRQARARVFLEALRLHQTFLALEATRIRANLDLANALIQGQSFSGYSRDAIRSAWASLFMVVPVLSSTFASFDRSFGSLGCEEIGWLLVDEAGQATPQAAVGALWRARRAVFVGDPLQLKPIMTVSDAALEHMRTHFGVDNHWLPNRHSAQTLADQATPWGRTTGPGDHQSWVGLPLVVHRRCDRPMFELANRIAYDGNMVYGTIAPRPDRETPAHLPTGWLHATGTSQGNWVAEEGRMLQALLAALRSDGVAPGDIAIVTPFRGVLKKIPALVRPYRGKGKTGKISCGTIHTMQGKEAPVVIMVLGGNTASPGARDWAVSEPNLLNVAATRAKRRFYVIGDRNDWQRRALFCDVMDLLPALDLHAEDIGGALHQKALASRDRARATGRYRSADEVLDGLRALRDEERTRRTAARKA